MSPVLRILLILASCGVVYYVMHKIRKKQLNVDDAIYWIFFAVALFILSVFPRIATWAADLIGFETPANFVFMFVMFVTLVKLFHLAIELSVQKHRINALVQKLALTNYKVKSNARSIKDKGNGADIKKDNK